MAVFSSWHDSLHSLAQSSDAGRTHLCRTAANDIAVFFRLHDSLHSLAQSSDAGRTHLCRADANDIAVFFCLHGSQHSLAESADASLTFVEQLSMILQYSLAGMVVCTVLLNHLMQDSPL